MPQVPNFNPGVGRLTTDRFDFQGHVDGYSFRHEASDIDLSPPITITTPSNNVRDAITQLKAALTVPIVPDATTVSKGIIQLSGDIGGTATSISVLAIRGFPVSATPPTTGYVLTWNGSVWTPTSISGAFTFAGDVTGTALATTVVKINGKPVAATAPGTGDVLFWNGTTWLPSHITPTGTGFATVTSGNFDAASTLNIRYTGGKFQTDANIQFKNSSITGDLTWAPTSTNKTLTLPDITDVLVTRTNTETLINKTLNATNNTITDTSTAAGDILVSNGTKFLKQAKGSNGTFWGVSGGVAGYYTPPGGGGISVTGTGFITATAGSVDPAATANIRYSTDRFQTDVPVQWNNGGISGDLTWAPTSSNKTLTLPNATDTLVGRDTTDTLTGKTLNATNNSITDTSIATGDLLKSNGTKFVRFAKGSALQVLRVNAGGTDLEFAAAGAGASSTGAVNTIQTSDGAGAFLGPTNVLAGATFISVGATPSTVGFFRVPNGTGDTILGGKDNGGTDVNVISRPATNSWLFGNQTNQAAVYLAGSTTNIQASSQVRVYAPSDLSNPAITVSGAGQVTMNPGGYQGFMVNLNASANGALMRFAGGVTGLETTASGHIEIGNTNSAPANTPTGGGYLYVNSGALKYRGSSGTLTTIGPAEPHCKKCGKDFMHEWQNDQYGYMASCMPCLLDALETLGIDVNAFSTRELNA